jgi:hypothetical protein
MAIRTHVDALAGMKEHGCEEAMRIVISQIEAVFAGTLV